MLDIKYIRANPEIVKENIRKKFQPHKLALVDDVLLSDEQYRAALARSEELRAERNATSKRIGMLMGQKQFDEAESAKSRVGDINAEITILEQKADLYSAEVKALLLQIPQIIADDVPLGKDDSENVELERFGEPVVPDFEIPYHTDILESFRGLDIESAREVTGAGFYYLKGDVARLHSAIISYARDFMIGRGFEYYVPPFMIRGNVLSGVMSQTDAETMAYKIEGEDLYLIGTSEHSMIGRFIDKIIPEAELPYAMTSYSPCFRKEVGAHGIEEKGLYRVHQFEKQEMVVICRPDESAAWYDKLWRNTVDFFRTLDIPVRTLECCSGDLADIKVKSVDIEGWSPRQQKYFEVGSCSNIGDAQSRRLSIRVKDKDGNKYLPHTLNNTVVAPPRMLICFFENNLQANGNVSIPTALQPYMGGQTEIVRK
jgi:seryl-tRNA synthetase